jgi:hypothetical protein
MADSLITDPMGVQAYLAKLDQLEAVGVDLLLVFQSPFADSTLVTSLVEGSGSQTTLPPIFLWAIPEP